MAATAPCVPACNSTPLPVNVPGQQGNNAYTTTTGAFAVPAVGSPVSIPVVNSGMAAVGQVLFIATAGYYTVVSLPNSNTIVANNGVINPNTSLYIAGSNNAAVATVIASGVAVNPSGSVTVVSSLNAVSPTTTKGDLIVDNGANAPLPSDARLAVGANDLPLVADSTQPTGLGYKALPVTGGGTGAVTKAAAQTGLGLGRNATISTVAALTQAITAGFAQIGAISAVAPAAGSYLISGFFSVDWNGVTFAASRVITAKVRNITQGVDYGSVAIDTQILTTTTLPTSHYCIPPTVQTLAVNDTLQILVTIAVVNSAGTLTVTTANLTLLPLALS